MAKLDPKTAALRVQGALNLRPEDVVDELFGESDFFDARDLVQVKYEMLRRARVEGRSVTRAARDFGLSRPSYYQAREAFDQEGLPGLLPKKRGPKAPHKITDEVLAFVEEVRRGQPSVGTPGLTERVEQRFGLRVHPRSLERALARRGEGRREKRGSS